MRYLPLPLPLLLVAAIAAHGFGQQNNNPNATAAPTTNPNNVFVLKINDEMIEALKNGLSLESQVPEEARGRFQTIRIQYESTPKTPANPNAGSILQNKDNPSKSQPTSGQNRLDSLVNPGAPPLNQNAPPTEFRPGGNFQLPGNESPQVNGQANSLTNLAPPPVRLGGLGDADPSIGALNQTGLTDVGNGLGGNWPPITFPREFAANRGNGESIPVTAAGDGSDRLPAWTNQRSNELADDGFLSRRTEQSLPPLNAAPQSLPPSLYPNDVAANETDWTRSVGGRWPGDVEAPAGAAGDTRSNADRSPSEIAGRVPVPQSESEKTLLAKISTLESANKTLESQRKESTKWTLFLFLFLMCSLGANAYLGWIARGFYSRFHQMANDLRDTFSSSSSTSGG